MILPALIVLATFSAMYYVIVIAPTAPIPTQDEARQLADWSDLLMERDSCEM